MPHKHTRHHKPRLETLASSALDDSHGQIRMRGRNQQRALEREAAVLQRIREIRRAGGVVNLVEVLAEFPATGEDDGGELLTRLRMRLPR